MKINRTAIGAALVIALTLGWATDSKAKDSARTLLNRGNAAFAAGDYVAALAAFQAGNEGSPSPIFQRSIGYALLKLYQHQKARAALQEYLKKYPTQADAKKIRELVAGLDVVVETKVSVISMPPGAAVYFDTEATEKVATTPFEGSIEPGKHVLILKLGRYHTTVRPFTIPPGAPGEPPLLLKVPLEARLEVDSTPRGADVYLDSLESKPIGKTRLTTGVGPGKHKVFITMEGYETQVQSLDVTPPTPVSVTHTLGVSLRLASDPPGAKVELDGKALAKVTPLEEAVVPGEHRVTISLPGYKPFTATTAVTPGGDNQLAARLEGSLLTMRTDAPGATVSVAGRELGATPTERASVPLGRQQVVVSQPGRRPWSSAVDFDEGQVVEAEVRLARPTWPIWVAGAVAVVGTVIGIAGYVKARGMVNDANAIAAKTTGDPNARACSDVNAANPGVGTADCGVGIVHMGTAGAVIGGTAAGVGLLYWLIWGRSHAEVRRVPATPAVPPAPPTRAAQRPAATAVH